MKEAYNLAEDTMAIDAACCENMPRWTPNCVGLVAVYLPDARMHDSAAAPPALGPMLRPTELNEADTAP